LYLSLRERSGRSKQGLYPQNEGGPGRRGGQRVSRGKGLSHVFYFRGAIFSRGEEKERSSRQGGGSIGFSRRLERRGKDVKRYFTMEKRNGKKFLSRPRRGKGVLRRCERGRGKKKKGFYREA